MSVRRSWPVLLLCLSAAPLRAETADMRFAILQERFVRLAVEGNPALAQLAGVRAPSHAYWPQNSTRSLKESERAGDRLLADLRRVRPRSLGSGEERALYAGMIERLEANRALRVCRLPLWADINHLEGWQTDLADLAAEQAVDTASDRAEAMARWSALPGWIDQEIANAGRGLRSGYSMPRAIVRKVVDQLDALLKPSTADWALQDPARRSSDPAFKRDFGGLVAGPVRAALERYRSFLRDTYLPRARASLGLSALPNGAACYRAFLRRHTTLRRSPRQVFRLGQRTVAANASAVAAIGVAQLGTGDLGALVERLSSDPQNRFASRQDFLDLASATIARARRLSAPDFFRLPRQAVVVQPGGGPAAHYEPSFDPARPASYRLDADLWRRETRGGAEVTAVHETIPGHHLQIGLSLGRTAPPAARLVTNAAFVEGWARYAEILAEEEGVYGSPYARITRRLWPGRGMVADPGLHLYGWPRERVIAYVLASGRMRREEAEYLVDRMVVMPGQLTAYDTGALEILRLREAAKRRLGAGFDIRAFHQAVLGNGPVPLRELRRNVVAWVAKERLAHGTSARSRGSSAPHSAPVSLAR